MLGLFYMTESQLSVLFLYQWYHSGKSSAKQKKDFKEEALICTVKTPILKTQNPNKMQAEDLNNTVCYVEQSDFSPC